MATVNSNYTDPNSATLDKATGAVIDETMTDAWSSNFRHIAGSVGYIGCRAAMSVTQSVATATATQVNLGAETFDSDPGGAMHGTGAGVNPYITVQTAGVYLANFVGQFASNATGYRSVTVRRNATTTPVLLATDSRPAVSGAVTDFTISVAFLFSASDVVDVYVEQTSGGALTLNSGVLTVMKL